MNRRKGGISICSMDILGEMQGEDLNVIFSSFPGMSFQGLGFHKLICQHQGIRSVSNAAGSEVSCGGHLSGFATLPLFCS